MRVLVLILCLLPSISFAQTKDYKTYDKAVKYNIEGNTEKAIKFANKALEKNADWNKPNLLLASIYANNNQIELAANYLLKVYDATNPVTITGVTSGVKAYVIGYQDATATTQPILYLNYYKSGTDNSANTFSNSENITADKAITHTTGYVSGVASATTFTTNASQVGSSATIEDGVIYIRGQFVKVSRQTLLLSADSITETTRIGLNITESLLTPEADGSLTDNSRGSSNYAAKGAHRLKIDLTLAKLDTTSTADSKFIEMMRIDGGTLVSKARVTEYSVLGDTLARRTFDESGDYTVKPFIFDTREISEIPSLKYCFQIAAFISRIKSLPVKYLEKSSIIVSNSMIQTLIDLVFSIQTPISDVYIYTSTDVSELNTIFDRFESNNISDYKLIKCN